MIRLQDKTLVMIVGPTAVGKSTLMNEIVRIDPRFARVSGFTSRAKRPNDEPGLYRYVTPLQAEQLLDDADTVQAAVHPTTGIIYGSQNSDYPSQYNVLDTLSGVVSELRRLPFKKTITISVTTPAETWLTWLNERYPDVTVERRQRIEESIASHNWSITQTSDHHWVINAVGDIASTAQRVIAIVEGTDLTHRSVPSEARQLLKTAESLLSYKKQ